MARPKSAVSRGSQIVSCCILFRQYCTPFKAAHHLRWTALWGIFWQLQRRYELDIGENLGEKTRVFFLLLVGLKEDHFWVARCRKTRQTNYIYIYTYVYIYMSQSRVWKYVCFCFDVWLFFSGGFQFQFHSRSPRGADWLRGTQLSCNWSGGQVPAAATWKFSPSPKKRDRKG